MSDVVLPTRLMGMLEQKLILTNAAGGANFDFKPGSLIINDHITIAIPSPLIGENIDELSVRFPDKSEVPQPAYAANHQRYSRKMGIKMQEGYICSLQDHYETPAEVWSCKNTRRRCRWYEYGMWKRWLGNTAGNGGM